MSRKFQYPEQYAEIRQALDQLHDDAYRIHLRISKGRKAASSKARAAKAKRMPLMQSAPPWAEGGIAGEYAGVPHNSCM